MADQKKHPEGLELTGEYRKAMETISARLMARLPGGDDLWKILGQSEAILLEAQMTNTPLSKLFGKGGVAGFCQSIIDERAGVHSTDEKPAAEEKSTHPKQRKTANPRIRKKKRIITALVISVWVILVGFLTGQYTGFWNYIGDPHGFYLAELHNFKVSSAPVSDEPISINVALVSYNPGGTVLYSAEDYRVTVTYVGFDDDALSAEKGGVRRFWVELTYTTVSDFSHVSYVAPPETGKATAVLTNGDSYTQDLHWQGEGHHSDGTAYIRLYFLEVPKSALTEGGTATLTLSPLQSVTWTRIGVGRQSS